LTKAELIEENDALLDLLSDIGNEAGSNLPEELQTRISDFIEEDGDDDE
jgi:hypothetical protein